ncbi:amidohydrolase family protein [Croceibacterium sp. TMG7-5b_MA50]|uniref:amidohydrolase family protein n=1 Tax=Croceibacterium sp. TMG7-5b_MA50 TaxID=3121290 RepID=UPI0032213D6E
MPDRQVTAGTIDRVIDSHVHLWSLGSEFHQWPEADLPAIHQDFNEASLVDLPDEVGAVILVQAQPDIRETEWLLSLAEPNPLVAGVVGWLPHDPAEAAGHVRQVADRPKLVGFRPMLQNLPDINWLLDAAMEPVIAVMTERSLRFDALVRPTQLGTLHSFARAFPGLRIVIDHGAKPVLDGSTLDGWREGMARLADLPNVWCKLSGLRTEQPTGAAESDLLPVIEHLLRLFPGRLMWGSDWPVLRLVGDDYPDWLHFAHRAVTSMAPAQVRSIFADAAAAFYGVNRAPD